MTLVAPAALLLLLAAAPIVWFFLRRPPVPSRAVSSLLLARALATLPQRSRRLPRNELVPLALMLGALLLLVTAISLRPRDASRPVVVVLDDSETSPLARTDQARAIEDAIHDLALSRPDATFTVVGLSPPGLRVEGTTHIQRVLDALVVAPDPGPAGDPGPLLRALCTEDAPTLVIAGQVDVSGVPPRCTRQFITEAPTEGPVLRALASTAPNSTGDVWLHVVASGADTAIVEHAGTQVGTVKLAGPGPAEGVARVTVPPGSTLTVRVGDDDAARSRVALPRLSPARTLVRTHHPDGYLATLATVHPRLSTTVRRPGEAAPAGPWDLLLTDSPAPVADSAAVVAVFGRAAPELGVMAGPTVQRPTVTVTAPDDPLLHLVELDTLHITTAATLRPPANASILASTASGPIAAHRTLEDGRTAVVFGISLSESDLPLRADFVHLVANLVDRAAPPAEAPAPAPERRPAITSAGVSGSSPTAVGWTWLVVVALTLLAMEGLWLARRTGRRP